MGNTCMGSTDKVDAGKVEMNKQNVYPITLRAANGQERTTLAWFPNEAVRADFYEKARKRGLEIIEGMF